MYTLSSETATNFERDFHALYIYTLSINKWQYVYRNLSICRTDIESQDLDFFSRTDAKSYENETLRKSHFKLRRGLGRRESRSREKILARAHRNSLVYPTEIYDLEKIKNLGPVHDVQLLKLFTVSQSYYRLGEHKSIGATVTCLIFVNSLSYLFDFAITVKNFRDASRLDCGAWVRQLR